MKNTPIRIKLSCKFQLELSQATPMIALLNVHGSLQGSLEQKDKIITSPQVPLQSYFDSFENRCVRMVAPPGTFTIASTAVVRDTGEQDAFSSMLKGCPVEALPEETLMYLLGSRYCETDLLSDKAWTLFEATPPGGPRVQAICDFVHDHIEFDYLKARNTRGAVEAFEEAQGVCRDYAHLAITFCRCMNIPARYCTGYLGDIGMFPPYPPGDFAAWIEVWLDGSWRTFDPRNKVPRIGRILVARGRDAADVPMIHAFGSSELTGFEVSADQLPSVE